LFLCATTWPFAGGTRIAPSDDKFSVIVISRVSGSEFSATRCSLQMCSRYRPYGTFAIESCQAALEIAYSGVVKVTTTALISGWMLQKM